MMQESVPVTTAAVTAKTERSETDIAGLIVVIILPLFAVMVIATLAGLLCYCGYRL
jgi:hypothetical protein